jgi:hypothetical protein
MRFLVPLLLLHETVSWTPGYHGEPAFQLPTTTTSRRQWIGTVLITGCSGLLGLQSCEARDELFQTNPLTNPVLEQVRTVKFTWTLSSSAFCTSFILFASDSYLGSSTG